MLYKDQFTLYAFSLIAVFFFSFLLLFGLAYLVNMRLDVLSTRRRRDLSKTPERLFWRIAKYTIQAAIFITTGLVFIVLAGFTPIPLLILWILFFVAWGMLFLHKFRSVSLPSGQFIQLQNMFDEEDDFAIEDDINIISISKKSHSIREKIQHYIFTCKLAIRHRKLVFAAGVVTMLIFTCALIFSTSCMCIALHPLDISTGLSRRIAAKYCEPGQVCNVYFTLGTQRGDFIANFQTAEQPSRAFVCWSTHSFGTGIPVCKNTIAANNAKMTTLAELERYIVWADLPLQGSNVTYYIVAGYNTEDKKEAVYSGEFKIRSLPEANFTFVSGGDMSMNKAGHELMAIAASHDPYFAMIGGDITYDNGIPSCYQRWDQWFHYWQTIMVTSDGCSIPIMAAIGNHEAGGFLSKPTDDPYYSAYFPQQTALVLKTNRSSYHAHRVTKDVFIVSLDTDVVSFMDGAQASWLENQLKQAQDTKIKMALYHGNLYPGVNEISNIAARGITYWAPIFDRYKLDVAFENHCHAYKRTFPIRNHQKAEDGVVYLGDGAWGVQPRPVIDEWYLEKAAQKQNVYVISISEDSISATALGLNGDVIDKWQKNIV